MSKKCVAFDIGNVLCEVDLNKFIGPYNSEVHHSWRENFGAIEFLNDALQHQQDIGITTVGKKLTELCLFGCPDFQERKIMRLEEAWNDTIIIHDMMIKFKNDLLRRGVQVALLSNMGFEHKEHIKENHPELFEGCILHLSCDVGARKPSKLYFQSFLLEHPEFRGALYIDDRLDNLAMAEQMKFRPYHFELEKVLEHTDHQKEELWRNLRWCIFKK